MPINHIAERYLDAYHHNGVFDGGLSFRKALAKTKLDSSTESLGRIDYLLGKIHTRFNPSRIEFIKIPANVNFLYLLSFYIGHVVTCATGAAIRWYDYDELVTTVPEHAEFHPRGFGSSITCVISGGTCRAGFFAPLAAIEARLYEDHPAKSVASSAGAFM